MSGPCTDCGGPDCRTLEEENARLKTECGVRANEASGFRTRITELEAEIIIWRTFAEKSERNHQQAEYKIKRLGWQMEAMWGDPELDYVPTFDSYKKRLDLLWSERSTS